MMFRIIHHLWPMLFLLQVMLLRIMPQLFFVVYAIELFSYGILLFLVDERHEFVSTETWTSCRDSSK